MKYFSLLILCWSLGTFCQYKAEVLKNHVEQSIKKAQNGKSKLTHEVLQIEGLTGHKIKHLLNNLCSLKGCNYLEIGTWKGSTFIAALYNNQNNIQNATVIDDWSYDSKQDFMNNIANFIPEHSFYSYEKDCFKIDLSENITPQKIDIYFFDAGHRLEEHYKAFYYYNSIFSDVFIAIVDDYNWPAVQQGTQQAFKDLHYKILYECYLSPDYTSDRTGWRDGAFDTFGWWNGLYVAVIQKN